MNRLFQKVKVLIWDFDGTFYRPNPDLWKSVREAEYRTIINHTGWSLEKTVEEFNKFYKLRYESATETSAVLSGITTCQAAVEMERYFDRRQFVSRDEKLIHMFFKLKSYRHFILANGVAARHREVLLVIGIPVETFEEIVTSETVGVTKPDPAGFFYILKRTGLPPEEHLMIGDRESVDLAPAKKLGMKTCLVWSDKKSDVADITVNSVYDVLKIV